MTKPAVDCSICVHNVIGRQEHGQPPLRRCSKNILTFPNAKIYCAPFQTTQETEKEEEAVAKRKKVVPIKKAPDKDDPVHLQQFVDPKKKDVLRWYIYLP